MDKNIDAIVVGAGPSGIAAAVTIARGGKNVLVIERGAEAGVKNMFGGAVYTHSIRDIFPKTYQNAPYERFVNSHSWALLTPDASTEIAHKKDYGVKKPTTATVFRPKFDRWMMDEAKKEGVIFATNTVVRELIVQEGKVAGIRTDLEDFLAPVTVIADGVNSLLAEQIGLKSKTSPKDVVMGVKEVIKLPKEVIEERFGIKKDSQDGVVKEFFGGLSKEGEENIFALGFLYTFKNYISIGLGVSLEDLSLFKTTPYELLEKFKNHPLVKPLTEGAEAGEYSAHLIPEGGFKALPKLYTHGALLVGDAAGLVNSLHFEGTNLAMTSGKLAGETVLEALSRGKFDEDVLKIYKKKLFKSYVIEDLKSYRNIMDMAKDRVESIFGYYPKKADQFFTMFTKANGIPKRKSFREFAKSLFFDRSLSELFRDCYQFAKSAFEVIK